MNSSPPGGGGGGRESPSSTASSTTTTASSGSVLGSVGSGISNGCRHSGASFDSGRATSSTTHHQHFPGVRYGGGGGALSSESSLGSFRHSYHSSNSSLGSIPSEEIRHFDVGAMISQGVPDHEILNAWLTGMHLECYYPNFIQAGYDMHTISRMLPEDLNAIGVTKPHHRKKIKGEISQLNISQGLPDYIPESLEEWLRLLRLEEYLSRLLEQGYRNPRQVTNITWEDLDDIGILKLGHQKKFMLALKRVQDIVAGKRVSPYTANNAYGGPLPPQNSETSTPTSTFHQLSSNQPLRHCNSMPYSHPSASSPPLTPPVNNNSQIQDNGSGSTPYLVDPRHQIVRNMWPHNNAAPSAISFPSATPPGPTIATTAISHRIQVHHPPQTQPHPQPQSQLMFNQSAVGIQVHQSVSHHPPPPVGVIQQQPLYQPEVISIRVKNGHPNNSLLDSPPEEEPIYGTSSFFNPSPSISSASAYRNRSNVSGVGFKSYEEGATPTTAPPTSSSSGSNLSITKQSMSNTWTLPRLQKHKPISKVMKGGTNNCDSSSYPINPGGPFAPQQLNHPLGPTPPCVPVNSTSSPSLPPTFAKCGAASGDYGGRQPPPPPRRSSCSSLGPCSSEDNLPLPPPPPDPTPHPQQSGIHHNGGGTVPQSNYRPQQPQSYQMNMYGNGATPNPLPSSNYYGVTNQFMASSSPGIPNGGGFTSTGMRGSTLPKSSGRDSSPGGGGTIGGYSDSDLTQQQMTNGFLTKGVRRNGSDASFKSNSSTESESIPFANDNAGTIKQQKPSQAPKAVTTTGNLLLPQEDCIEDSNVLSDIGSMLADLTDQLDAILEQERTSKH